MGSFALNDNFPSLTKTSSTTVSLGATAGGRPTRITVGGQSYGISSPLILTATTNGVNGLDVGSTPGFGNVWYVYAIVNQSSLSLALIASLTGSNTGPTMPSGYGTAYKLIGAFVSSDAVSNTIVSAFGLSANLPGVNTPGGSYDPTLGWVFTGATNAQSVNALTIAGDNMTGGQNVLNVLGTYSPNIMGQYSSGRTLIANNVYGVGNGGNEAYAKKSAAFGSNLLSFGLGNADYAFEFRNAPDATVATIGSPQTTKNGMWSTQLGVCSTTGSWTFGSPTNVGSAAHVFYTSGTSASLRIQRTDDSSSGGYVGADATFCFRVYDNSVGDRFKIDQNGIVYLNTSNNNGQFNVVSSTVGSPPGFYQASGNSHLGPVLNLNYSKVNASYIGTELYIKFTDGTGTNGQIAWSSVDAVAYQTTSDRRLKKDIVDTTDGLDIVRRMQPRDFTFIRSGDRTKGFIAQELVEVFPWAVTGNEEGDPQTDPMQVEYGRITPVLAAAIKDLANLCDDLKAENDILKARVAALESK